MSGYFPFELLTLPQREYCILQNQNLYHAEFEFPRSLLHRGNEKSDGDQAVLPEIVINACKGKVLAKDGRKLQENMPRQPGYST